MKDSLSAVLVVLALLSGLDLQVSAFAQGSLTPPGAPAPTMKTLDQVEPRTPITSFPATITQSGSYYLTRSVTSNFAGLIYVIGIFTNDVTVDLCGFALRNTGTNAVAAVYISPPPNSSFKNVNVKNGSLVGFNVSPTIVGFAPRYCALEDLKISGAFYGVLIHSNGTAQAVGNVFRNCRIFECDTGIEIETSAGSGNVIDHCEGINNTNTAFRVDCPGNLIVNCRATGNGNDFVIAAGNRAGLCVQPATNSVTIFGASGGPGSGTTDPFANLSY